MGLAEHASNYMLKSKPITWAGLIITFFIISAFAVLILLKDDDQEINSFDECIKAGNPVMESYPRQCRTSDGELFVEDMD